ncbi:hypothetical protein I5M27_16445 [Adhaeribacter sp. BT258]|uniref:Peptidase family C25 n=1 Tax=Adhaeribacter terrigena TaxID=2793070 RepID=A0ABS1C5Y2_9BACT|nr:C25 family cysteine peptidase [Adhaeribacter terrigena]MBK0404587.1 hypothetical protein [Adhaeribacter terrigena]
MRFFYLFRSVFFLSVFTFLIGFPTVLKAQTPVYGNEWINYSQPYYKIKVVSTGMHRLTYNDLVAAGISNVNPQKFQIFRRGQEVAIYVNGQSDGTLNSGDYIDFYGQKNDGKLDNALYRNTSYQLSDAYSLFTDTAAYYLTWGAANGKRMVERTSQPNALSPEPRHYAEKFRMLNDQYFSGYKVGSTEGALGEMGEGFTSTTFSRSRKDTLNSLNNVENTGRNPWLEVGVQSANATSAQLKIMIKPPGGPERVLTNAATGTSGILAFPAYNIRRAKFEIQNSDIHPNGVVYIRTANADSANTALVRQTRISYYKLTYARTNDLGNSNRVILTDSVKTTPSYFQFSNAPANAVAYEITNPNNIIRTTGITSGGQVGFVFDPATFKRRILITNTQTTLSPAGIKAIQFSPVTNPSQFDYVIITHPSLRTPVTGTAYTDPPADYAAYRASTAGGNYKPVVVNIDQLYEQFHYGEKSSMAIRNFMQWMMANGDPKFMLLMGKGLEMNLGSGDFRKRPNFYVAQGLGDDLVPTFGFPASDVLFTADYKNNSFSPQVATGRIPATTSESIIDYLEKVQMHEVLGVEEWRKNILHLGGGSSQAEAAQLARYLSNYENKVEGPLLGANVKSILRSNNGAAISSVNVKDEVNTGLTLMTFFGHSSSSVSDLDIGYVSDAVNGYNNPGKFPMILMNGCGSGNAFLFKNTNLQKFSFGENWLLTPKKGAILFLADVFYAVPYALNNFSSSFYNLAFTDSAFYGKTVGEINAEAAKKTLEISPNNWENFAVATQMVLQGDPAVRLFAPEKPDYTFQANGLRLQSNPTGSAVTASMDKFDLVIDVKNLGKAIDDSLVIAVKRTLPNGSVTQYKPVKYPPVYNKATYLYEISSKGLNGFGNNKFEVTLDAGNSVDELNETNNEAVLESYLSVNGVIALLPAEFGIVSNTTVKLVGQPANLLSPARNYYFEIDTVNTFNSPFKRSSLVTNANVMPSWKVNLFAGTTPKDSLVFYWRFRFNEFGADEDTIWAESSFRYINNSPAGWSQSHYAQFIKDNKESIERDSLTHDWEFAPLYKELLFRTGGGNLPFVFPPHGLFVNNNASFYFCGDGTTPVIMAAVFNNRDLKPYMGYPTNKCGWPQTFYVFEMNNQAGINGLVNFIQSIPDGYYVALMTQTNVPFSTFTQTQKDAFKLIGSKLIDNLQTGYPFGIVGQKGATAVKARLLKEQSYDSTSPQPAQDQNINFSQAIQGNQNEGKITSTKIGPAAQWTTLHHTVKTTAKDEYTLDLYGFDLKGNRTLVQADIQSKSYSLAGVSAQQYPYLQLEIAKADTADRSAPQLEQWLVVYQPVPEGMMRPDLVGLDKYENISKQAEKGKVKMRFAFSNISGLPFSDSLSVVRSVSGSKIALQDTIKVKRLMAGDSIFFDYEFSTAGMKGNNTVRVDVNPYILPEQYYFNNFLEIPFTMPNADLHPVVDVVFDGVHIMDGDLVSPSPKIAINLKDEDRYDYVQDPNKLEVFLSKPDDLTNYERIDMSDASLITLPDMDKVKDKRDFNIMFNPKGLADGVYSLRVQGRDNSDNEAGFEPYSITFRVVNESSITHFYPYPNPFSSHTRFVFTLTGNPENMPRNLKIQIMTVTGKVVREIQKEELGPIHVGNNMSLPWDGTDEYGDKLANGAYLYRVVMEKSPLEEMKHRKTAGDKAFKKEYGKLYILR